MLLALAGTLPASKNPGWQTKGCCLGRADRPSGNMPDEASRMLALPVQDSIADKQSSAIVNARCSFGATLICGPARSSI